MVVCDYMTAKIKKQGRVIDKLRVVGVAVEMALRLIALTSLGAVDTGMLGGTVTFFNPEVDGVRKKEADVSLHLQDAVLALALAVDIMTRLRLQGYALLPACQYGRQTNGVEVPQRGSAITSIVGSHDVILDCTAGPRGRISAEVKLRRARDQAHLEKVRKLVHQDCNTVWDAVVSETPGVHGGQLLLLYSFPVVGDIWVSRADFRSAGGSWRSSRGWGAAAQAACAKPQVLLVRSLEPTTARAQKRRREELKLDWFEKGPQSKLKKMVPVSQMLSLAGKGDVSHAKRFVDRGRTSHSWPAGGVALSSKAATRRGRAGGRAGWAATEPRMRDLLRALKVP